MCADRWIVSQVNRRACLVELLLQNRIAAVGVAKQFGELSIAFAELLLISFKFPRSLDGQFCFGLDFGSPLHHCGYDDDRTGFESTSPCVV